MVQQSVSQRLHAQLSQIIAIYPPGARLPSEPELANQLGVSRATLRETMRTFETQGLIRRRQGSGTYVNQPAGILEAGLEALESLQTIAQRTGIKVKLGQMKVETRPAKPEERRIFSLIPDEEVIQIARVILSENRPAAYLIDTLPTHFLTAEALSHEFKGSVLDLLLNRGDPQLLTSKTEINAVPASSSVAHALQIQRGVVLLCLTADLYTTCAEVVSHSISYFVPGCFRFHVIRKVHGI